MLPLHPLNLMIRVMNHYKLNKRFAIYGFLISYIFGGYYMDMGIDEKYAVIISVSGIVFFVIGIFGVWEHYPYSRR